MRIEMDENSSWVVIACFITLACACMVIHGCAQNEATRREAFKSGLQEVQVQGSLSSRLAKP
jgi:hypothetical protein